MSLSNRVNKLHHPKQGSDNLLTLVLDEYTDVGMSDRPIFGATVTIREDIGLLAGSVLQPGLIIGWLNYVDVRKFACISDDKHFQEASNYFHTKSNQLILSKPIFLHHVDAGMRITKQLLTFSDAALNVHSINKKTSNLF